MKKQIHNQGIAPIVIVVIIAILAVGGGAAYYLSTNNHSAPLGLSDTLVRMGKDNATSTDPCAFSTTTNETTDNRHATTSPCLGIINQPVVAPSRACDYLTSQDISSAGSSMHTFKMQPTSNMCIYSEGSGEAETVVGAVMVTLTSPADTIIKNNWKQALDVDAKSIPIPELGDTVSELDHPELNPPTVTVYFFKNGAIGAVTLKAVNGKDMASISKQAKAFTKIILGKI